MKVFIYAYESTYGGMHGINTLAVYDVSTLAEADEIGFKRRKLCRSNMM